MTTTGYGDVVPQTAAGRILGGVVMMSGILVFALWSGILANGYAQELRRREFLRTWELVAKVPFFHNIGASLIAEVARLLRPRDYPAGAVVMRRGQPGDCMYFIADGEVEIQLPGQNVYLISGQFFGEVALLTGAPRNATVVATQPSTLLSSSWLAGLLPNWESKLVINTPPPPVVIKDLGAAPDVQFSKLDGSPLKLKDLRGRVVLVSLEREHVHEALVG